MSESRRRLFRPFGRRPAAPADPVELPPPSEPEETRSSLVAARIYVAGQCIAQPETLEEAYSLLDRHPHSFAWLGLYRPHRRELASLAAEFRLNPLAVEDTIVAHQRPKLERYEDTLFMVLRAAHYVDEDEQVVFGEVHAFAGERFVITVRHSDSPDLTRVRQDLEAQPRRLAKGPSTVLQRLLDIIVDDYEPVVSGLENDIEEIETEVFSGHAQAGRRIYQLSREVLEFQRALRPLRQIIDALRLDKAFAALGERRLQELRDIEDHAIALNERTDSLRENLHGILQLNQSLQTGRQNEEMAAMTEAALQQGETSRRIAAWAGVLFVPSLITGTYGMNFQHMPELGWVWGYPFALVLMLVSGVVMYLLFRSRDWL
ncbi:magnesium and cobalt transport protein CorA [Arachnia propionica]|uniref:Magnesium and cobalt transport protein CorA n=1 Tax=Arachnia propionica TaxID=1750 RepID=A0A3P1T640_9ACTN|nr:magnesium and cobalt transport protein CorA [Arachnia propionica]MDO5083463.1 magnesium and cobalt transport protein CorA [Arachnia propionica]RRD04902.1 magnesium and cobalt transport protein CorA [Arachnia propionica]